MYNIYIQIFNKKIILFCLLKKWKNPIIPILFQKIEDKYKKQAIIATSVIGGLFCLFIFYYIIVRNNTGRNNFYKRLTNFFGLSIKQLSIAIIIAFIASDLITAFNNYITIPLVESFIPTSGNLERGFDVGRGKYVYPGLVFISIFSFFITLVVIFLILEIIYMIIITLRKYISQKYFSNKYLYSHTGEIIVFIILAIMFAFLVWNAVDISKDHTIDPPDFKNNLPYQYFDDMNRYGPFVIP